MPKLWVAIVYLDADIVISIRHTFDITQQYLSDLRQNEKYAAILPETNWQHR